MERAQTGARRLTLGSALLALAIATPPAAAVPSEGGVAVRGEVLEESGRAVGGP